MIFWQYKNGTLFFSFHELKILKKWCISDKENLETWLLGWGEMGGY
jgi:hypothetical protein